MIRYLGVLFLVLVLPVGLGGCPGSDEGSDDAGFDAGLDAGGDDGATGDDGGSLDADADDGSDASDGSADAGADEGGPVDGGDVAADEGPADVFELSLEPLTGWQRGPVRVVFTAFGPTGRMGRVSLAWSLDGQTFQPATALVGTLDDARDLALDPLGVGGRFVWDSKSNMSSDQAAIWLRASLRVDDAVEATAELGPFELRNSLDTDRVLVVPHPYAPNGDPGDLASVMWLRSDGSLEDTGQDLACGEAPALAAFTADGRHGVVLGEGYGHNRHSLLPFAVGRDGQLTPLGAPIELYDLLLSVSDLVPAPDGSGIWLVHYTGEGGLFFLSFESDPPALVLAPGGGHHLLAITLPTAMALLPDKQRALVSGGALSIDDPPYDATLIDLSAGAILSQTVLGLEGLSDRVAVTPDGSLALLPSPSWGGTPKLWAVPLVGDGFGQGIAIDVPAPAWIQIHPEGGAALLTSWDDDSVSVIDLRSGVPLVSQTIQPVGLADHMDCVREGALSGLCLVASISASTGISALVPIQLSPDATASRLRVFEFGDGLASICSGPAIQP